MKEEVCIKDGCLIFNVAYEYPIELERINTTLKAYQWIMHLLGKSWITKEILSKMVLLLEKHFDYNLRDFSQAG